MMTSDHTHTHEMIIYKVHHIMQTIETVQYVVTIIITHF